MKNTGIEPKDCPTPEYHSTHRYCPSCNWDETMSTPAERLRNEATLLGEPEDAG